jgi:hypothetical protein
MSLTIHEGTVIASLTTILASLIVIVADFHPAYICFSSTTGFKFSLGSPAS